MPTPPPPLSPTYTPKIQVTHPHVPDFGSQRHLVDTPPPSPPYHGQDNPVFNFDKDALFHRAPSQVDPISLPHQPESPTIRSLPPLRRGSYSPFLPATDKDSLAVPVLGARRQSLSSSWGRDSVGGGGGGGGGGMSLLPFPHRHPKPPHRLSIENVTSDMRAQAAPSPGLLSMRSLWSRLDYMGTPAPRDLETASKHRLSVPREGTASIFSSEADLLYRSSSELLSLPPSRSSSELLSVPRSSFCTSSMSNVSGSLGERMHELVRAFSSRTQRCKERISQPPTPSSTCSEDDKSDVDEGLAQRMHRLGSFLPAVSTSSDVTGDAPRYLKLGPCRVRLPRCCSRLPDLTHTMESYSKAYVSWLFVVMLAYVYNSTVIPLRGVFPYQTKHNWHYWLMADYFFDLIYLTDIVMFKSRLRFTQEGVVETDYKQTQKHYIKKLIFKLDMLSLLPLDIMYLTTDEPWLRKYVWLRLPRMLKVQTFWEFYSRCDQAAKSSAHAIRIVKTMTYMLYLIHIETCGYYAVSEYEGLATNQWVYNNKGNAYIRCFYLATKTATSIGNNPKPTNTLEFLFMTLYWLSGVFVFALLIGQIRDIVEAAGQVKTSYRKKMDAVLHYMKSIQISDYTRDRAREWFLYNWEQSKTIDERSLVAALPKKLQTDLAISVHFNTLIKVQLFQDCERNLLYDLVLKLKPNLFLPGDYVCQKGEVGKEMYIVSQGQVQVVGGEKGDVVLATLSEGSVFGEISLLAMSGRGNRRTADVRCSGYTSVFTLSKDDFEEAMNEYPEAQKLLRKRAKKLLKENARKMEKTTTKMEAEEIIKTPHDTPKMVRTVIQVLNPESQTAQKLHVANKKPPPPPPSTSAGSQHLTVPMSVPKIVKVPSRAQGQAHSNLAFDLSDEQEQMKPSIVTQYYDDDDLMDHDDEIIVIERTEEALPLTNDEDNDLDDILKGDDDDNDDDDDDSDRNDNFKEPFEDAEEVSSVEQEFFNSVMAELRAQDVVQSDWRSTRPQPQANSGQTNDHSKPQNHNLTPQNESIPQQNEKWRQNGHVTHQNNKKPQNEDAILEDNTSGFQDADTKTTTESNTSPVPEETTVPSGEVGVSRNETTALGNETTPPQGERTPSKVGDHRGSKESADEGKTKEENKQGGMKRGEVTRKPQPKRADRSDKTQGQSTRFTESSQLKEEKQEPDSDVGGRQRQHRQTQGQQQPQMPVDKERQDGLENGQEWKERDAGSLAKDIAEGVVKRVRESDTAKDIAEGVVKRVRESDTAKDIAEGVVKRVRESDTAKDIAEGVVKRVRESDTAKDIAEGVVKRVRESDTAKDIAEGVVKRVRESDTAKDIAEGVVKRVRESDTAAGNGGQLMDKHSNSLTPHHRRHHHDQQQQQGDKKTGEAEEESEKKQGGDERGNEEGGGELSATSLSHVISVGIGGVRTQETPSLPTNKRQRKVSTVNQPRLSADLSPDPAANTPTLLHHHHHHHHPTLTPIEAFSKGDKLLRGMGAPPASQVTCSVEVHREHGLTTPPVAVTSAMTRSLTEMTTTAAAEMRMSARSSPSTGPASAASPLTPDLDRVGESVV